jgi:mannose-6-phosphate isomerase-like protein (cupin superfamily)
MSQSLYSPSVRDNPKRRRTMPKASRETASRKADHGVVFEASEDFDGYTLNFVEFRHDIPGEALVKGAPNDQCQCPHWGYVLKGRVTYRVGEREEVYEAGDAFYLPPGHVPLGNEPGSELMQFSPTEELNEIEAVIMRNLEAMQAAGSR